MGRIVKQLSEGTSRYYWYPGEKEEWVRALVALAVGGGAAALIMLISRNGLTSVVTGCAATLAVAGFNFGRRDARALAGFPNMNEKAARFSAVVYSGRAAWRGVVQGLGAAFAAVLVLNVGQAGWTADWLMPLVPGVVGALGHQAGMIWDRLATNAPASPVPVPAANAGANANAAPASAPAANAGAGTNASPATANAPAAAPATNAPAASATETASEGN